jgi:hypothetical protein
MKNHLRSSALIGPMLVLSASILVWAQVGERQPAEAAEPVLIPFTPTQIRVVSTVETAAFFHTPLDSEETVRLEELTVSSSGYVIHNEPLEVELMGDPRFAEVSALIERMPHNHRPDDTRYFAAADAPEFAGHEVVDIAREVAVRLNAIEEEYAAGRMRPYIQLDFPLHMDQVFAPEDPVGSTREVVIQVAWSGPNGLGGTSTTSRAVTLMAPPLSVPNSYQTSGTATSIHAGDLHVHSCHGEASGACAPSGNCAAESFQTSGSFSFAQLRSQYQALGIDWFTATDHSYCVNSSGEYNAIVAECAAQTDGSFLVMPDLELSSDEVGSQSGSDLANALCLGLTSANHMGAHQINARIPGGEDGFLGFCDGLFSDVLNSFTSNISTIRSQGGYPIAHHPTAGEFGWNSYDSTQGIEANALHGVEVWNGATQSGQGGDVGRWIDWLLDGRLLYAYSGSDTHDEATAFGSNNVLLEPGEFSVNGVHAALRGGRHFISNGHVLIMEAGLGGSSIPMGSMHPLPPHTGPTNYTARVHYNFGADTSTISIFTGRAGDGSESTLCQSGPLTGQGVFECSTPLETSVNSWVRAYSQGGSVTAYTNPVFFLPSSDDPGTYCTAKINSSGCGAQIGSSGVASATSALTFDITASEVVNNKNGIMFYGYAPAFNPFSDGTLCVSAPLTRTAPQNSAGNPVLPDCSGNFSYDFNARIQSGIDGGLIPGAEIYGQYWYRDPMSGSGSGLSNAIYFSIGP